MRSAGHHPITAHAGVGAIVEGVSEAFDDTLADSDTILSNELVPGRRQSLRAQLEQGDVRLGDYQLMRRLGAGATGEVFAARHTKSDELVALKGVIVGGSKCEASLAVEAPDEACEWRLVLRAVYEGARGFDAAVELPAISVVGKALDAGAAEFVPGA